MRVRILRRPDSLRRLFVIFPTRQGDLERDLVLFTPETTQRIKNVPIDGRQADRLVRSLQEQGAMIVDGGPGIAIKLQDRHELRRIEPTGESRWRATFYRDGQMADGAVLSMCYLRLGCDIAASYGPRGSSQKTERLVFVYAREPGSRHALQLCEVGEQDLRDEMGVVLRAEAQRIEPNALGQFNWVRFLNSLARFPAADVKDVFGEFAAQCYRSYVRHQAEHGQRGGLPHLRLPRVEPPGTPPSFQAPARRIDLE